METQPPSSLSFRDYVLNRNRVFTPTGTFFETAKNDSNFLAVTSADDLEHYLTAKQMPAASKEHARTVWRAYLNALKRNAKRGGPQSG
jgi:N-formylglutamate amidohydrolase